MRIYLTILLCVLIAIAPSILMAKPAARPNSVSAYEDGLLRFFDRFPLYQEFKREMEEETPSNLGELNKKSSRELLNQIRESPYGFGKDGPGIVLSSRHDADTGKILLQDLAHAQDYYLVCLVNILSEMPSAKRDNAFLQKLTQMMKPTNDFLRRAYIVPMIWALAVSKNTKSMEIIKKYASNKSEGTEIRAHCRVALNVLGHHYSDDDSSRLSVAIGESRIAAVRDTIPTCTDILTELLRQGLLTLV